MLLHEIIPIQSQNSNLLKFLCQRSNHFSPLLLTLVQFIFYHHDEPPGRSPYRPYLLPPLHLGAKTTRILSPSSQPTAGRARTISAAAVPVPSPHVPSTNVRIESSCPCDGTAAAANQTADTPHPTTPIAFDRLRAVGYGSRTKKGEQKC